MKILFSIVALLATANVWAQKYQDIDLSLPTSKQSSPTIGLTYKGVKLVNKLPKGSYKIKVEVEEEKDGIASGAYSGAEIPKCYQDNPKFKTAYDNLLGADDETKVKDLITALNAELKSVTKDCAPTLKTDADKLISETEETSDFTFDLKKNQNITVNIYRIDDNGNEVNKWTVVLQTPRTVNYFSHFGFTYVPNGSPNSDRFFSKKDDTNANTYIITRMNNNGADFWKDLSITANYIVLPFKYKNPDSNFKIGWNGGFGLSGDAKFTIFTGPTILLNDFLSINLCAGLYNKYKLRGEYTEGQKITENLSLDQLNETGLRPSFIISIGFRLSKEQVQAAIENKGGK